MIKSQKPEQRERAMFEGINRNRDITIAVGVVVIIVLIVLYATNMLPGI
jgi:tetrahydromethanopterin S-methyltransferase subunit F